MNPTHGHVSNGLAIASPEDVELVVKMVDWVFFEEFIALEEAVVVANVHT